jgi:hypothetical protein
MSDNRQPVKSTLFLQQNTLCFSKLKGQNMKDKVVLITGGSRGIGLATAKEFIAGGRKS